MIQNFTSDYNRTFVSILVLCIISGIAGSPDANCSLTVTKCGRNIFWKDSQPRIVGGKKTKPGEYPWMVSVREYYDEYGFIHVCGGSILNENWIVSAAHCFEDNGVDDLKKYEVLVGLHMQSRQRDRHVKKLKLSEIIMHEDYGKDFENDIALLRTAKPIPISGSGGYINGICLPSSDTDPSGYATIIGWGHEMYGYDELTNTLMRTYVPIVPRDECKEIYEDEDGDYRILDTMICAGERKRDACQSDSGGPMLQTNRRGVSTLMAIVSHGTSCGSAHYPGVYTKVGSYLKWMASKVCS